MKILWICHFSNTPVRDKLHFSNNIIDNALHYLIYKKKKERSDFAAWITNGIIEFEKFKEVELHIVSPHADMKFKTQEFEINGIHYHFFKPENNSLFKRGVRKILKQAFGQFKRNRRIVKQLINKINPDVIHMYGAENPYYSITALDIDVKKLPLLVTLQTLMSDPIFKAKTSEPLFQYQFRSNLEIEILNKIKYIGSSVPKYREIIWRNINYNAIFFESGLAIAQRINLYKVDKVYDFVYFASSISKAVDVAIEGFAIACEKYPSLTLNIIGGSSPSFSLQLKARINELGIKNNIVFSGRLPTHEDVLKQIQKSKYALLPLKIDHIAGTLREAIYSEIPVVTTKTHGTPTLNEKRESVLISEQDDYIALAENMIKLIELPDLVQKLKENGLKTVNELWNNNEMMSDQVKAYKAIYDYHHYNKPIPTEIGTSNPIIV